MLKYTVEKWDKNQDKLRKHIEENMELYNTADYEDIIKMMLDVVFEQDEFSDDDPKLDTANITTIDNGDYQGTQLFVIPFDTYQPSEYEYLMTYIYYGSCSGCDTLQAIQFYSYNELTSNIEYREQFIDDMMKLCLDLARNIIVPYNTGWRYEDKFEHVEGYVED